jgi:hypothetical protein
VDEISQGGWGLADEDDKASPRALATPGLSGCSVSRISENA